MFELIKNIFLYQYYIKCYWIAENKFLTPSACGGACGGGGGGNAGGTTFSNRSSSSRAAIRRRETAATSCLQADGQTEQGQNQPEDHYL